jgi:hypothetical protein
LATTGSTRLCCSTGRRKPLKCFDTSLEVITRQKLEHVRGREPICKTRNHDPINRLDGGASSASHGDGDEAGMNAVVEELISNNRMLEHYIDGSGCRPVCVHARGGTQPHETSTRRSRRNALPQCISSW